MNKNDLKLETQNNQEKEITVKVSGVIDTNSSEEFGQYINDIHNSNQDKKIIIDFKDMSMLTSAGIRHILSFKKNHYDFEIINIKKEVFTVFKITGLSKILDLDQETISVSVDNCELLGQGFSSKVYKLDEDTIAKIYYDEPDIDVLIHERMAAKQAFIKGVPTEISFGMCEADGQPGLIYELVNARTLLSIFVEDDSTFGSYIKEYVHLVKKMNEYDNEGFADLLDKKKQLLDQIQYVRNKVDEDRCNKMLRIIQNIPDSNRLIHGDAHPANIMATEKGLVFIDLSEMGYGDGIFDLVYLYRTMYAFNVALDGDNKYQLNPQQCARLFDLFFDEYCKDMSEEEKQDLLQRIKLLSYTSLIADFQTIIDRGPMALVRITDAFIKEIDAYTI